MADTNIKRLIAVDGNSIMFRAYFATAAMGNLMQARSGIYTNAIYGFINMMQGLIANYPYDNILVAFDKGKKTIRHQTYADYKGGRKTTPEELLMQIPYVKEYLDVMNIKHLELDDYEADDIVGSFATLGSKSNLFDEVLVVSGDKDLLQLTGGNIHVGLNKKGVLDMLIHTEDNFFDLMGIKANQMVDYKALIGDSSDNLPGIAGIGPKTACDLLKTYGTVDNLYNHTDELKGKLQEKVINGKESCYLTKKLATIYTDVVLPYTLDDTKKTEPNYKALRSFYEKLDFKSFIKKLPKEDNSIDNNSNSDDNNINTNTVLPKINNYYIDNNQLLLEKLKDTKIIYMDIELSEENYHHEDSVLGVSIVINNNNQNYDAFFISKDLLLFDDSQEVFDYLKEHQIEIYTIDSKKLYVSLRYLGIYLDNFKFDLTLACYVDNPAWASDDVKYLYEHYFENQLPAFEDIYKKRTIYDIPSMEVYSKYCADKACLLGYAKEIIDEKLKSNQQYELLYDIEIPLSVVLGDMEIAGFKIDVNRLNEIGNDLTVLIKDKEQEIYKLCGEEFNIASPKQLGEVLFEKLKLPYGKKKATGYSTSVDVLEKLAAEGYEVPKLVIEYRKYTKLYGTYVVGLLEVMKKKDQKLHTIFRQALTLTGRLSSTEPNIQNIPVRTEDGRMIRSAFIPSHPDGCLISADYSQIELRILAHLSNCEAMIKSFNDGVDLHAATAALIFGIDLKDVTKNERRIAKAVNFGIVYGMSSWGLSEEISITPSEASEFIKKYFTVFKEIEYYLNQVIMDAKENLYTETMYHRRRYMPEIKSSNFALRSFAERTAKNAPIQGSAADIIKLAMISVHNKLKENHLQSKLIAQVHDELVIDTYPGEENQVKQILLDCMQNVTTLKVKLQAELAEGKNWDMK